MEDYILLAHGSGGMLSHELIRDVFARHFSNPFLDDLGDAAIVGELPPGRLALTTDSYVVQPLFFPGGDIGKLAVCGTVNDLAVAGARPLYLTTGFILEEGLPLETLERVVASMAETARAAGVFIVTGDTKVVEHGAADGLFINTAGVGIVPPGLSLGPAHLQSGDALLINGPVGDHGLAVMLQREGLAFQSALQSDVAPLHGLIAALLDAVPGQVRCMRDATRGGLASVLNEWVTVTAAPPSIPPDGGEVSQNSSPVSPPGGGLRGADWHRNRRGRHPRAGGGTRSVRISGAGSALRGERGKSHHRCSGSGCGDGVGGAARAPVGRGSGVDRARDGCARGPRRLADTLRGQAHPADVDRRAVASNMLSHEG